jgi:hypothetical protein
MDPRSEEIGSLLREQEQAIIAERAQAMRLAGRAGQLPAPVQPSRTPQDGTQWLGRARTWLAAGVISVVLGTVFVAVGAEANSPDLNNQTPGAPELWIGGILIVGPILATAISILVSVARFSAEQARRYRAWKKTLAPEQLAAARMAEWAATFAALEGAHIAMRHSNERMHALSAARQALHEQRRQEHQERTARIQAMQDAAAGYGPGPAVWQHGPQPRM